MSGVASVTALIERISGTLSNARTMVGGAGLEPAASAVSRLRSPTELPAYAL